MGILNVTPDSFSDGGQHYHLQDALEQAASMVQAGALVLDIGGESTRPGADPVDAQEELRRVLPLIEAVQDLKVLISIDTMKPVVARAALKAGAHIVNDVTGLRNPEMVRVCIEAGAPAIIMHMQGEPRTMQQHPTYQDVTREVKEFLFQQAEMALQSGVPSVMLDPGIGFGKTLEHNLRLIRDLPELTAHPVLLGVSRKKMIDRLANVPDAKGRDPGSIAVHLFGAGVGVAMVRVHDVPAHVQALKVWSALRSV
ncbi:dihydropteroate synthase [Deinococcus cellulosilyticus NBRC 106333 = KACC 11606]|uniref:dihydropteroate synthase n=2 Tax=Deinococcus cellulosilyticus TaxID=401558 RepID=A0A511N9N7_DEIC1|nr:dihydropteroate synthase [Deinococcus cellulosilyticus]GEM49208.1 dihydropteroate synthase [Deinococcus cellulosilyticus NBRC 106333 = KACC 11606]